MVKPDNSYLQIRIDDYFDLSEGDRNDRSPTAISYPANGNDELFSVEDSSFWFQHRNACIAAAIARWSGKRLVVDLGGGNGVVARKLLEEEIPSILVEPGPSGARNAAARGVMHVICDTFEGARPKRETIPAVGLFDVIEHIKDEDALLNQIHSALAPDGVLYLTVPYSMLLWSNADHDAGHYRRYTRNSIRRLLEKNGFRVDYASCLFLLLPPAIFLLKTLPSLLGLLRERDQNHAKDHSPKKGLAGLVLDSVLGWELRRVRQGQTIPLGSSLLVAATKLNVHAERARP